MLLDGQEPVVYTMRPPPLPRTVILDYYDSCTSRLDTARDASSAIKRRDGIGIDFEQIPTTS